MTADDAPAPGGGSPARAAAEDEDRFAEYSESLADAIDAALAPWVVRSIDQRLRDAGRTPDGSTSAAAAVAAERCRAEVTPRVRALLSSDLDEQRTTPLAILRSATGYATDVLRDAGVAPVQRDEFDERAFPDDVYALSPAAFSDVDPALHEPGLVWGAAKAHIHLARRRAAGQR